MKHINTTPPHPSKPINNPQLIDTHCHLDMIAAHADVNTVLSEAAQQGVTQVITIGIDVQSSQQAILLAHRYQDVYATVGVHPHNAGEVKPAVLRKLAQLAGDSTVVGFGEIGLDYVKNHAPQKIQRRAFTEQLHLAKELNLPIIIHDREAHADIYRLLEEAGPFPQGGVIHCFSGDLAFAEQMVAMGFALSIPGVVTFSSARSLHEVIRHIDLTHLLVETDSPYLAPVPFRGKRNEPKFLIYTAQKIAEIKEVSLAAVAQATTANAIRLFHLPHADHDS
ncbi:TatD family hydrolase [Desulfobulbus oligotrophicus]|jgi:TatD DNase family protein|uniref:TatD family hydrolase n=1 Tax=Desulfobulbus oligotrophicus TaxID=1909699 RepID=A0A7T6ARG4_9BACT|nr:TatD family hydrolase [Desulfobulbus oligotrophicus]MDY0389847.1 TatD family hydrolase [Desulfobulbus oligotrophicus]QQG66517.1 TatD family hydrolase [Desulfobulbus oligotrophicus]